MDFHPHKFHPTHYALDPYDLLLPVDKSQRAKYAGPCKYHYKFFGQQLIVERDCKPSKGYFACEDCKVRLKCKYDRERHLNKQQRELLERDEWIKEHAHNKFLSAV